MALTHRDAWNVFCLAKTRPAPRTHSRRISMILPIKSNKQRTHALMHKHQSHMCADTYNGHLRRRSCQRKRAHDRLYFKSSNAQNHVPQNLGSFEPYFLILFQTPISASRYAGKCKIFWLQLESVQSKMFSRNLLRIYLKMPILAKQSRNYVLKYKQITY